jgi:phosphohistidine phosphatase
MRHAEALPVGGMVTRDADRHLSPRGEEEAAQMGRALSYLDGALEIVVSSPLVRAKETGEIISKQLGDDIGPQTMTHLGPGFNNSKLLRELRALRGDVVAIGHQPDLSRFISFLLTGTEETAVDMPAGAIAKLVLEASHQRGCLEWLLTPAIVKALSK